ncbi:MAG: glycosyltransferase [Planctomycetota bacterium JB042]
MKERLSRLTVGGEYFVAVGKDYPHKDHATMFRALAALDRDVSLIVAGQKVWRPVSRDEESSEALLERLGLTDRVRWIHGLSDDDVKALLQGSRGLLYPSLEEGFGLPPLEAMALGVPVAAAAAMSIPEVCGDGALLFEPGDVDGLAERMRTLLDDPDEVARLVDRGAARLEGFTWEACAEGAIASYRRAVEAAAAGRPEGPDFAERMALVSACPFRDGDDLLAWQERCRNAEQHAWNLEDQREELLHRIRRNERSLEQLQRHVVAVEENRGEVLRRVGEAERELDRLRERAAALQAERDALSRPNEPEAPRPTEDARPRWSLKRRIGKIRRALNGRPD